MAAELLLAAHEQWSTEEAADGLRGRPGLAVVAHDHKKIQLIDLAVCYRDVLAAYRLVATRTTGRMLQQMVGLKVDCVRSGLDGGDRQIAQAVASGNFSGGIFLGDPFTPRPPQPRVDAVMR